MSQFRLHTIRPLKYFSTLRERPWDKNSRGDGEWLRLHPKAVSAALCRTVYHRTRTYLNSRIKQNHSGIADRIREMRTFKNQDMAGRFCREHDKLENLFRSRTFSNNIVLVVLHHYIFKKVSTPYSRSCKCVNRQVLIKTSVSPARVLTRSVSPYRCINPALISPLCGAFSSIPRT